MSILSNIKRIVQTSQYNGFNPDLGAYHEVASEFTPDAHFLDEYAKQLLFVYDQMMHGFQKFPMLGETKFKGGAFTKGKYRMFQKELGPYSYPVALKANGEEPLTERYGHWEGPTSIKGELYLIDKDRIYSIDRAMENTVQFNRKRIHLYLPVREVKWVKERTMVENSIGHNSIITEPKTYEVRAWAYIGNRDYWGNLVSEECFGVNHPDYLMKPSKIYFPVGTTLVVPNYSCFTKMDLNVRGNRR